MATASSSTASPDPPADRCRRRTALRAERRRANLLEKEIRTLRKQLNRFSEINPEEYARLQEAEHQMEEASAMKVAASGAVPPSGNRFAEARGCGSRHRGAQFRWGFSPLRNRLLP